MITRKFITVVLTTLFLGLCSIQAWAVSFTVMTDDYSRGNVKYKLKGAASYTGPGSSFIVNANVGDSVLIVATSTSVYGFSYWDFDMANPPMAATNNYGYWIAVTEAYNGITVTAKFTSWSPTNIVNGATYTLATSGSGTDFSVTSDEDTRFNGKVFSSIGRVEYSIDGGTTTIEFNTSQPVWVMERIHIMKGFLTLKLGDGYTATANHPSLLRHERNTISSLIIVDPPTSMTDASGCRLAIQGKSSANFVIHGNCEDMAVDSTNMDYIHFTKGSTGVETKFGLMDIAGGKVDMEWVTFTHSWRNENKAAGIYVVATNDKRCPAEVTLEHSIVEWCRNLGFGSGIDFDFKVGGSSFEMTDCEVRYCNTDNGGGTEGPGSGCGGAIRSMGANLCALSLTDCVLHHNYTPGHGGAIRWHSALINPLELTNCTFRNNWAGCWGGAMRVESGVIFSDCTIKDNRAGVAGGGISYGTFTGGSKQYLIDAGIYIEGNPQYGWYPVDGIMALDADTEIKNNTAGSDGGAIHIFANFISFCNVYLNNNGDPYKMGFTMDGTLIEDNTAGVNGGAVYMSRDTEYYGIDVNLNKGTIDNNTATAGNGGSFCITEDITVPYDPSSGHSYQPIRAFIGTDDTSVTGDLVMTNNSAINGGGISVQNGSVTIYDNAVVGQENNANTCTGGNGGGVYVNGGDLTMYGGELSYNKANRFEDNGGSGGGFYVEGGQVEMKGGTITKNEADHCGGAFYVKVSDDAIVTKINSSASTSTISLNVAGDKGGGVYVEKGTLQIEDAATNITADTAYVDGGGIYMEGGVVTFTNAKLQGNVAQTSFGGGLYLGNGNMTVSGTTTTIKSNIAYNQGGGVYVGGGTFTMTGGTIGGTTAEGNYTTSEGSLGGGLYMGGGTADISGGTISGNTSEYGGAVYSANGAITVTGGTIDNNEAQYGGGIYAQQGFVEFSDGYIHHNHASKRGGGIYVDQLDTLYLKGSANLAYNNVPTDSVGGGVYLKGTIIVGEPGATGSIMAQTNFSGDDYTYTWENTGHPETDSIDHILTNNRNNIYLPNPEVRPDHTDVITIVENGISATSRVGFSVPHGNVPVIYCEKSPTSQDYLHHFSTGQANQYNLFDDTRRYVAVQYSNQPGLFDPDHVYLYGFWSNEVTGDASEDYCEVDTAMFRLNDPIPISTPCELAFFITWVNGLNSVEAHPAANAKLMADIDMSEFGWVPIGKSDAGYSGVFDGNGHTVTGLICLLYREYTDYGFFGKLTDSAEVKNLFVRGANFYLEENGHPLNVGGLAGEIDGTATTLSNSEVSSSLYVENTGSVIGGLVGRQNAGMIHSCIAISDMTGNTMGGLVGVIESGKLYNSYANPDFSYLTPNVYYIGGLVAENSGTIQNCYVRPRDPSVNSNTKLGLLIGWNKTGGNMKYCYSTEKVNGQQQYVVNVQGTCHYRSYLINTETPYQYLRRDNQVTVRVGDRTYIPDHYSTDTLHNPACTEPDLQMLLCLNNWVTAKNTETGTHPIYSSWQRPTTKIINDDLPVLMMPGDYAEAIAATDGDPFLYYSSVNNLIGTYTSSSQAIWLYKSKQDLASNDGSAAKLYIAEHDIVGKPLTVIPNGTVHAYVGVTLDNSAGLLGSNPTYGDAADYTDWHMFSTPLTDAPLGVYYTDDTQWPSGDFSFPGHPTDMPYYHFYDNEEAATGANDWERRGYFPSHVYKTDYDGTATGWETTGGNYYRHWDYYTYYEPEYHWINFKRNDNSHWHEKAPDIPIYYDGDEEDGRMGNEHYLVKGRGYLLATREDNTFLQCHGTLNTDEVRIRVTRDGFYNPGYNFLGNPYLTYLDFDEFARVNGETLWGDSVPQGGTWSTDISNAAYAIIDEDPIPGEPDSVAYMRGGYKYYTPNATIGKYSAPRYIAPHQGFMILATQAGVAKFNTGMRSFAGDGGHFRGDEHPAYALVNLLAIDGNGNRDITTVELGRPDKGGAPLMRELKLATCHVYSRYEGKDWAIAFTQPGVTEVAIRFEAYQDGEYTLRWDTENGEFHYLHLIDNLTGTDIDCLTASEYRFTSTTMDYKSRFRLVFGYTGIEEPEIEEPVQGNFAYQSGDALVVTGEGTVELFDVMGRKLNTQRIEGVQGTMSVSGLTPGVYLLRLATTKGIRVQKIVINQ